MAASIDDAPDRLRFEAALERWLLPAFGELSLREVLGADHYELCRQLLITGGDGDDDSAPVCLNLILDDSAEHLRVGAVNVGGPVGVGRSRR